MLVGRMKEKDTGTQNLIRSERVRLAIMIALHI